MAEEKRQMGEAVNISEKLALLKGFWQPGIVGRVNDMHVKLARLQGEFLWHAHEHEDEMFLVVEGRLVMRYRDRDVTVLPGEFVIVPRTVEHMPVCETATSVLLFEPAGTLNTGDAGGERTVEPEWI